MSTRQHERMATGAGFIAALDQSGGSTPKALRRYGIEESAWSSEAEMFDLVHELRTRIITSPVFTGERILGAILFEKTMERPIEGLGAAEYLWEKKQVVPFLKVDRGLAEEVDGAQVMKPIPDLDDLLARAVGHGVFGTKMRSLISRADRAGVDAVVAQQLEVARRILDVGLMPIVEPEVDIRMSEKAEAEEFLLASLLAALDLLDDGRRVMLKLTLPEQPDLWDPLVRHPRVLRVAALSGGYPREEASARLARCHGVIASFSRALTEGLSVRQTPAEFDATLDEAIAAIYAASIT